MRTGVGSASRRAEAVEALDADVASRDYHLTVGSVGAKWLLRSLSEEGKHDTALKLAMQTSFPSWGCKSSYLHKEKTIALLPCLSVLSFKSSLLCRVHSNAIDRSHYRTYSNS